MVSYPSEKDFIKDQISSFNTAIKEIIEMRTNYEKHMLGDCRGDNEKVLDALEQATKHLKAEQPLRGACQPQLLCFYRAVDILANFKR